MDVEVGARVLGRYVVEGYLSEGAMGRVYRARHVDLDMPVALKILAGAGSNALRDRFIREARLMARVRHPNVVNVSDFGFHATDFPCLVMELLTGEALSDRLSFRGPLPWNEVVELARGALEGLHAVHGAGVLHRDLKPSNLFVAAGDPEVPKLIDFGIARGLSPDATRLTRAGMMIGTPDYMAPEQLLGLDTDVRTDVFAMGVVIFRCISGQLPFPIANMDDLLGRVNKSAPPLVASKGMPEVPPALAAAVAAALSPRPESRPASARDLAGMLPTTATPHREPTPRAAKPPSAAVEPLTRSALTQHVPSSEESTRAAIVARLPASRLRDPGERRWLAGLVSGRGRSFTLGAQVWVAVLEDAEHGSISQAIQSRYGESGAVAVTTLPADFALTAAMLAGAVALPEPLRGLVGRMG